MCAVCLLKLVSRVDYCVIWFQSPDALKLRHQSDQFSFRSLVLEETLKNSVPNPQPNVNYFESQAGIWCKTHRNQILFYSLLNLETLQDVNIPEDHLRAPSDLRWWFNHTHSGWFGDSCGSGCRWFFLIGLLLKRADWWWCELLNCTWLASPLL